MPMNKLLKDVFPLQIIVSDHAANQFESAHKQDHSVLQHFLCDNEIDSSVVSKCLAYSKSIIHDPIYNFCRDRMEDDEK